MELGVTEYPGKTLRCHNVCLLSHRPLSNKSLSGHCESRLDLFPYNIRNSDPGGERGGEDAASRRERGIQNCQRDPPFFEIFP